MCSSIAIDETAFAHVVLIDQTAAHDSTRKVAFLNITKLKSYFSMS